jgi:hypothetical protein
MLNICGIQSFVKSAGKWKSVQAGFVRNLAAKTKRQICITFDIANGENLTPKIICFIYADDATSYDMSANNAADS